VVLNESAKRKEKTVNLVVCPTSLTYNWLNEIKKFFSGVRAEVLEGSNTKIRTDDVDILIINYEKVKSNLAYLTNIPFFYIILDEAHKIKNSKSVVTQSINQLKCERKLALSGTPL
jgi:SNF2 family DNA or RNA helicase